MSSIENTLSAYFHYCNNLDWEGMRTLMTEDFTHEYHPKSLNGLGISVRNRAQWLHFLEVELKDILNAINFQLPPRHMIVGDKVAVVNILALSDTIRGTKHQNEWLYIFHFNDEGKIRQTIDFMDSKSVLDELQAQAAYKLSLNKANAIVG